MKLRTPVSAKQSRSSKQTVDRLTLLSNLVAWAIVVICVGFGVLCLTKGGSGIQYGVAFGGLAISVCPEVRLHRAARFIVGSVSMALLS